LNSLGDATERALRLDERLRDQVSDITLPSAKQLTTEIRAYLFERQKTMRVENRILGQIRTDMDRNGDRLILLGPTIDKGLTAEHFIFDSGSRLNFSIVVREEGKKSVLLAYSFHYHLPDASMPAFLRFDLINRTHERCLHEPRSHLHPGSDDMRLPMPALAPIDVLDRIFFVVEPLVG
jgi:hypothetical protein